MRLFANAALLHSLALPFLHHLLKKTGFIVERYSVIGGAGALFSKLYDIPLMYEMIGPHTEEAIENGQIKNPLAVKGVLALTKRLPIQASGYIACPTEEHITKRVQEKSEDCHRGRG